MAVTSALVWREACDDKIWLQLSYGAHGLQLEVVVVPLGPHLVHTFGISKVKGIGETLVPSVDTACGTQFVFTNHTELGSKLVADQILSARTPSER